MAKVDPVFFSMIFGCLWSICILALGIAPMVSQRADSAVELFAKVYVGYGKTPLGCFIGAVWGFVDGAISGMLIAWIYNLVVPSLAVLR